MSLWIVQIFLYHFNGLSNSPPDCFHRQSRPSLFESLAVLSTKNNGTVFTTPYRYSLAESKGLGSLRSPKSLLRKLSYYRLLLTRLRLAKDCKGSNPINNSQKIKGTANAIPFIYGGEQGIFRRTAVRLRIASLFNHGLSNSPPDCFHRQSRPPLFESLAVLSTKNNGTVFTTPYRYSLAESKGLGSLRSPKSLLRKLSYYRLLLTRLRLAKDCKGSNPINNSQKNKGYSKRYTLYFWQMTLILIETV